MSLKKVKFKEFLDVIGGNVYLSLDVKVTDQTISDIKHYKTVPRLHLALSIDRAAARRGYQIDWLDIVKNRKIKKGSDHVI